MSFCNVCDKRTVASCHYCREYTCLKCISYHKTYIRDLPFDYFMHCSYRCVYKHISLFYLFKLDLYKNAHIVNDQIQRLNIIENQNKKRSIWTRQILLNHVIKDIANIIIEY